MNEQQQPGRNTPCLETGQLMAWHDGALPPQEADEVKVHLTVCTRCAAEERALMRDRQHVFGLLTTLDPPPAANAGPAVALARFQQRLHAQHTGTFLHHSNWNINPGTFPLSSSEREGATLTPARPSMRRHRLGAFAQTLVAAMIVAAFLGTTLLLLRAWVPSTGDYNHTNNTPAGRPTLMLSQNVASIGNTIQLDLKNFPPSTRVALTRDLQEPIHLDGGSSIISVGPAGSANVDIHIDSDWGTGFHLIMAEDLKTRYTASATLQITGNATQAYARFVATNGIMFGFDAQHTHFNPFEQMLNPTTVGGLTKKWAYDMGSSVIASPTVAGGVVYIGCVCGYVYALDAASGTKKWAYSTGGSQVADEPAVVGGVVYIGSIEGHTLYALDAASGTKKWTYQTRGSIISSPTVVGGVVYVGSDDNTLYALDAATGAKKWAYWTRGSIESSPAVAAGVVYVGSFDGNVYALDAVTGAKKWVYRTGNNIYSSPAVAGGMVYVGSGDGHVYALDAATGAKKWAYWTDGSNGSSPAVSGGMVYVGSGDGHVYALDAATGTKKWISPIKVYMSTDPVLAGGLVYFGSGDGILYALDATTGAKKWDYRDGSTIDSSPAVADGVVYYGSGDGILYAFHLPGT